MTEIVLVNNNNYLDNDTISINSTYVNKKHSKLNDEIKLVKSDSIYSEQSLLSSDIEFAGDLLVSEYDIMIYPNSAVFKRCSQPESSYLYDPSDESYEDLATSPSLCKFGSNAPSSSVCFNVLQKGVSQVVNHGLKYQDIPLCLVSSEEYDIEKWELGESSVVCQSSNYEVVESVPVDSIVIDYPSNLLESSIESFSLVPCHYDNVEVEVFDSKLYDISSEFTSSLGKYECQSSSFTFENPEEMFSSETYEVEQISEDYHPQYKLNDKIFVKLHGREGWSLGSIVDIIDSRPKRYNVAYIDNGESRYEMVRINRMQPFIQQKKRYSVGDRVLVKYLNDSWYCGLISKKFNDIDEESGPTIPSKFDDKGYCILFDDNERLAKVRHKDVALIVVSEMIDHFKKGDPVECKYNTNMKWLSGVIDNIVDKDRYAVVFENGEYERSVHASYIRLTPVSPTRIHKKSHSKSPKKEVLFQQVPMQVPVFIQSPIGSPMKFRGKGSRVIRTPGASPLIMHSACPSPLSHAPLPPMVATPIVGHHHQQMVPVTPVMCPSPSNQMYSPMHQMYSPMPVVVTPLNVNGPQPIRFSTPQARHHHHHHHH